MTSVRLYFRSSSRKLRGHTGGKFIRDCLLSLESVKKGFHLQSLEQVVRKDMEASISCLQCVRTPAGSLFDQLAEIYLTCVHDYMALIYREYQAVFSYIIFLRGFLFYPCIGCARSIISIVKRRN